MNLHCVSIQPCMPVDSHGLQVIEREGKKIYYGMNIIFKWQLEIATDESCSTPEKLIECLFQLFSSVTFCFYAEKSAWAWRIFHQRLSKYSFFSGFHFIFHFSFLCLQTANIIAARIDYYYWYEYHLYACRGMKKNCQEFHTNEYFAKCTNRNMNENEKNVWFPISTAA